MTSNTDFRSLQSTGKDLSITPEERVALETTNPSLLVALDEENKTEIGVITSAARLSLWRTTREPNAKAAAIQEMITPCGQFPHEQGSLIQWCGFPTDMTRVSPFFPIAQQEMKDRVFLRDFLITAANWGEIRYTGPKLSIADEDTLLALLALLELVTANRTEIQDSEGRKTYTYRGPALPLLKILGYKRPNAKDYKRLIGSLEMLAVAGIKLKIAARTKTGKRKEPRFTSMNSMLSNVAWNEEKKELSATINPFFYETYFSGNVTLMDVQRRMAIAGSIAKGLYRFVQSHSSKSPLWTGHFLTLAHVLNVDTEQPAFRIRALLKKAINELIGQGVLTKQSKLVKQDIVTLHRAETTLPAIGRSRKTKNIVKAICKHE
jgi:hypothetical protein